MYIYYVLTFRSNNRKQTRTPKGYIILFRKCLTKERFDFICIFLPLWCFYLHRENNRSYVLIKLFNFMIKIKKVNVDMNIYAHNFVHRNK